MQITELDLQKINSQLLSPLSKIEYEVLFLIFVGKTHQQFSQDLFISINTLKRHINNVYMQLPVQSLLRYGGN
ncbi:MAG: helix-turn-helix transcriptional regulator [Saprospiraceae bacterium]|nr:helix-turn-helix transcriptional regulator [Saprospiraceae bacterium]